MSNKNQKDPRGKIGHLLKGPKRLEGESFEDYKIRRKQENYMTRKYLRGYISSNKWMVIKKNFTGRVTC